MAINLEKMLRPSGAMKKTARDIKNTIRGTGNGRKSKPVKKKPRRKKPPMTTQQKNESLGNMGMKPLGYWAKQFERFID